MLSRTILTVAAATLAWAAVVNAIIINPKITSPSAGDVWPAGSTQTVTWETKDVDRADREGVLVLGYLSKDPNDWNEHLDLKRPLAIGFKLMDGQHEVIIPKDKGPLDRYIIVLFGDSGNASPKFTITNSNSSIPAPKD
ncbi:hypothetical protein BG004_007947 [Podila humilis]|nr:hypothetical protein BG004_007947 [Podila humilis]